MPLALLVILCLATREDKSVREHGCEAHFLLSMFLGCKVSPLSWVCVCVVETFALWFGRSSNVRCPSLLGHL
jgi:hypothetical protein